MSKVIYYTIAYNDKYYICDQNIVNDSIFLERRKITIFSDLYKFSKKVLNNTIEVKLIDNEYFKMKFGLLKIDSKRTLVICYEMERKIDYKKYCEINDMSHKKNIDCAVEFFGETDINDYLESINIESEAILFSYNKYLAVVISKYGEGYKASICQFGMSEGGDDPFRVLEFLKPSWGEGWTYSDFFSDSLEDSIEGAKEIIQDFDESNRVR